MTGFAADLGYTFCGLCFVAQANIHACIDSGRLQGSGPGVIGLKAALGEGDRLRGTGSRYGNHTQKQGLCQGTWNLGPADL